MNKSKRSKERARGIYHEAIVGPRLKNHPYLRDIQAFLGSAIVSSLIQVVIYIYIVTRTGRSDWSNIVTASLVIALVPFLSAAVLTAFRRNEAPIGTAVVVSLCIYSFGITTLSALRIPISYVGLLWCAPVVAALSAYGNLRFNRLKNTGNIALAPFPGALDVAREIGAHVLPDGAEAPPDGIETLLIDPFFHHSEAWSALLARCYLEGVEVVPWTRYTEVRYGRLNVATFDVSHLVYSPSQLLYARTKRFLDICFVLLTLPVTLVLGLLVSAYIYARDGGPVIFVQIRRGYGGQRFRMYKFRTMYKRSAGGATSHNDKRIIPGCRSIRKYRLDEIPQLFNILRGDMSLIGPRPVAEYVARKTELSEPKYSFRSLVLPGITGWAQVCSGYAENTSQEVEKLSYDLYYIKHLSFDLDLLILFKTIRTVVLGSGGR